MFQRKKIQNLDKKPQKEIENKNTTAKLEILQTRINVNIRARNNKKVLEDLDKKLQLEIEKDDTDAQLDTLRTRFKIIKEEKDTVDQITTLNSMSKIYEEEKLFDQKAFTDLRINNIEQTEQIVNTLPKFAHLAKTDIIRKSINNSELEGKTSDAATNQKVLSDTIHIEKVDAEDNSISIANVNKAELKQKYIKGYKFFFGVAVFSVLLLILISLTKPIANINFYRANFTFFAVYFVFMGRYVRRKLKNEWDGFMKDKSTVEYNKIVANLDTFFSFKGMMRLFLVVLIFIALFDLLIGVEDSAKDLPIPIIISLNAILIYYGFKPEDVLPPLLVKDKDIEITNNKNLIDSFSKLASIIDQLKDKISKFFKNILGVINDIETQGEFMIDKLKKDINALSDKSSKIFDKIGSSFESIRDPVNEVFDSNLSTLTEISNGLTLFEEPKNIDTKFDIMILVILSAVLSVLPFLFDFYGENTTVDIVFSSSTLLFSYVAGRAFNKAMFARKKTNDGKGFVSDLKDSVGTELESFAGQVRDRRIDFNVFINKTIIGLNITEEKLDELKTKLVGELKSVKIEFLALTKLIRLKIEEYRDKTTKLFVEISNRNELKSMTPEYTAFVVIVTLLLSLLITFVVVSYPTMTSNQDIDGVLSSFNLNLFYGLLNWITLTYFASKK